MANSILGSKKSILNEARICGSEGSAIFFVFSINSNNVDQSSFRVMALVQYTGCRASQKPAQCLQDYNNAFGGKQQIAADDYMSYQMHGPCCSKRIVPLMIRKIATPDDLLFELRALRALISDTISPQLHDFGTAEFSVLKD